MKKNVSIRINGEEADYFSAEDLALKIYKRLFSPSELNERKGDYALNLRLPKTKRNMALLGFAGEINLAEGFFGITLPNASIEANGVRLLSGQLHLEAVTADEYECALVSETIAWTALVAGKSLRELRSMHKFRFSGARGSAQNPFVANLPNTISFAEVWATEENEGYDAQFPLTSYGNFPSDDPLINQTSAAQGSFRFDNRIDFPLNWALLYPTTYLRSVARAIFEDCGYAATGSFFTSNEYKNWLIAYTNESNKSARWNWGIMGRINLQCAWTNLSVLPHIFFALNNAPDGTGNAALLNGLEPKYFHRVLFDGITAFSSTQISFLERYAYDYCYREGNAGAQPTWEDLGYRSYRCPAEGDYRFTLTARNLHSNAAADTVIMLVCRDSVSFKGANGLGLWNVETIGTGAPSEFDPAVLAYFFIPATAITTVNDYTISATVSKLRSGASVEVILAQKAVAGLQDLRILDNTIWDFLAEPLFDLEFDPAWNLPNLQQTDFLKSLISMFNLSIFVDEQEKIVELTPYSSFFLPNECALDWSEKCSLKEAIIRPINAYKYANFRLTHDENDVITREGGLETDYVYASQSAFYSDTKEITVFYAQTKNVVFTVRQGLWVNLPCLCNQTVYRASLEDLYYGRALMSVNYKPRLLRWRGALAQE